MLILLLKRTCYRRMIACMYVCMYGWMQLLNVTLQTAGRRNGTDLRYISGRCNYIFLQAPQLVRQIEDIL